MLNASELKITINIADLEQTSKTTAQSTTPTQSADASEPTQDSGGAQAKRLVKRIVSYKTAEHFVDRAVSYGISTITLRTGAREYEERLNFVYSEGKHLVDSGAAIVTGAKVGGPMGAAVAAVGVALSYINKAIGWAQNANRLRIQQAREDISIRMASVRAGSLGRRYMGEE